MKGILLAGGSGSRLYPITKNVNKHLLPVYDKPLIYYPLSTLLLASVRSVLVVANPHDVGSFMSLLGDGSSLGINVEFAVQEHPRGIAEALLIGEDFLEGERCVLVLGDNILHGSQLGGQLAAQAARRGTTIFAYEVSDPQAYGVVTLDSEGMPIRIEEKPANSVSRLAIPGLYFLDENAVEFARHLQPSNRGELEITDVLRQYLVRGELTVERLARGTAWLDAGTPESLLEASTYVRVLEERQGMKIGCPEEVAWRCGLISDDDLRQIGASHHTSPYGQYLSDLLPNR